MKKYLLQLLLAGAITTSSCKVVNNLYPISENENDFLFKKELMGKWKDIKDSSGYILVDTVAGSGKTIYLATIISTNDKNKRITDTTKFRIRLIQIEKVYFIDCQLDIESSFAQKSDDYYQWLIARHFIYKIFFDGANQLELSYPDPDKLIELINENKIHLSYYKTMADNYLILNKPSELKAALIKSQQFPVLYKENDILVRLK